MNIKKPAAVLIHVNDTVKKWHEYAEEIRVNPAIRDAIGKTLILVSW
ncbi:MAG: hypothetical protein NT004_15065 [Bacteroidetes bacterium]|nr:hypothetical protein [Bacteroidota bacterium]